ncbi:hypothetical protein GCM10022224_026630 [Nonomuraea antimicrobica]|uniref:RHS repeat-associated core domain-containing protein n=1 Tax=Nonomuraea antimicrobica TaxID=561173 RepID=A0ABP7BK68_9ACTN
MRLYNPATGRFLQIDPVVGGSANAYDYCGADSVHELDLNGTDEFPGGRGGGSDITHERGTTEENINRSRRHHRHRRAVHDRVGPPHVRHRVAEDDRQDS